MITTDAEAWVAYPHHRRFFNKLWLSEQLGYKCGPAGIPVPDGMEAVFSKPIYNLSGMGIGSGIVWANMFGPIVIEAGHFWSEVFTGEQTSTTYNWVDDKWVPISHYIAENIEYVNNDDRLEQRISKWTRGNADVGSLHEWFDQLADVQTINIERIGSNIIEVHLRGNPDPEWDELIPVFRDQQMRIERMCSNGYQFVYSPDDADGLLKQPRVGFMVRNHP